MRVLLMTLIGAAGLMSATAPAHAQTAADKTDARCGEELTRRATALGAMFQRLQATRPAPPAGAAPQPK